VGSVRSYSIIVINEALLAEFRAKPFCEVCGAPNKVGLDPHHLHHKGLGGGSRLDIVENLLAVCRDCHSHIHSGLADREHLWWLVALRQEKMVDQIKEHVWEMLRKPKAAPSGS
jgi:hypothetical protein